jgi:hypothetical protein
LISTYIVFSTYVPNGSQTLKKQEHKVRRHLDNLHDNYYEGLQGESYDREEHSGAENGNKNGT